MKFRSDSVICLFGVLVISLTFTLGCQKDNADDRKGTENIDIPLAQIPAGTFYIGSPETEVGREVDENQHLVNLSEFRMSKYEITNAQFAQFLNAKSIGADGAYPEINYHKQFLIFASDNGPYDMGLRYEDSHWVPVAGYENNPVICVTWYGASEFATYVGGSLPTEAQWEYACRGNTTTPFNTGNCLSDAEANYNWEWTYNTCNNTVAPILHKTQAVGTYAANAYGLYDMHGNVTEWCSDWYTMSYPTIEQTDPTGPTTGVNRVIRGGGFMAVAQYCRSARRDYASQGNYIYHIGFRIVLVP